MASQSVAKKMGYLEILLIHLLRIHLVILLFQFLILLILIN